MNISRALLGLLVVAPFTGNAASLLVGGVTYQIGASSYEQDGELHDYNYLTPSVGLETDNWSLIVQRNVYDKVSVIATKDWQWTITDDWAAGVKVGTATGYKDTPVNMDVAPFMQFEIGYTYRAVTTAVGYVPPVQDGTNGSITMNWKIKLN